MTEPTRDALHALAHRLVTSHKIRTVLSAEEVNLAAECVRRVPELEAEVERLRAQNEKMLAAINWACGAGDSDFEEPAKANRYWWRRDLHDKAGLEYDSGTFLFRPTPRTDG